MKVRPEERKALVRPEFGSVTTKGKYTATNLRPSGSGKHFKGKVSPYNRKRKRK